MLLAGHRGRLRRPVAVALATSVVMVMVTMLDACGGGEQAPLSTVMNGAVPNGAVTAPPSSTASSTLGSPDDGARQLELAGATPEQIACVEQRVEASTRAAEAGGGFESLSAVLECLPKAVLIAGERLDLERTGASAQAVDCVAAALTARSESEVRALVAGATSESLRQQCGLPE